MSRHKARQQALELLYSREFHGENDIQYSEQEILENDYVTTDTLTEDGPELSDQERDVYCTYLVETTTEHRDELDDIHAHTLDEHFSLDTSNTSSPISSVSRK